MVSGLGPGSTATWMHWFRVTVKDRIRFLGFRTLGLGYN